MRFFHGNPSLLVMMGICLSTPAWSQSVLWQRTFGGSSYDYAGAIAPAYEGGYMIAGATASYKAVPNAVRSLFVINVDSDGNERWEKTIGSRQQYDGKGIFQVPSGYMIFSATKAELAGIDFDYDLTVTRINRAGEVIDERSFGTDEDDYAMRVVKRHDGGYAVVGFHNADAMVMLFDSTGSLRWQRNFGGSSGERATGVTEAPDGGLVITGWTSSPPAVNTDAFIAKFSPSGDSLWYHTIGTGEHEEGVDVMGLASGGYVILGYTGRGDGDIYYIRTDSGGVFESSEMAGIPGDNNTMRRLVRRRDGTGFYGVGLLSTSSRASSVHLAILDTGGHHVWVGEVGKRSDVLAPSDALEDADGSVIIVGMAGFPESQEQAFILKIGMPSSAPDDADSPSRLWLSLRTR